MLVCLFAMLSILALHCLVYTVLATMQLLVEPLSKDNSPTCGCYLTSGPDPGYFQYHRFWDFRNIPTGATGDDYTAPPALITDKDDAGLEPATRLYFNTTKWNSDWQIQTWGSSASEDSPVMTVNSQQNVFISRNSSTDGSTYLTLRASRLPNFMSISEIDSQQKNLLHCSIRARMRIIPNGHSQASALSAGDMTVGTVKRINTLPVDAGAVAGLFTYFSSTEESDIEILTRDPTNHIRYSNQPDFNYKTGNTIPGASTNFVTTNDLDWTQWLDFRLDWHSGITRWYINDQFMMSKTKNVPTSPSGLILNLWGNGGDWSGNMTVGGQVQLGVEWIEMVFNVSGPVEGSGGGSNSNYQGRRRLVPWLATKVSPVCHLGCTVDGVPNVGFPEPVFNFTTSSDAIRLHQGQRGGSLYSGAALFMLSKVIVWIL